MDVVELAPHVRPAGGFFDLLAVELIEAGIGIGLQHAREACKVGSRSLALAIGAVTEENCRGSALPAGRSSRTYVHNRPCLVVPRPGKSTGTGVSSPWSLYAPSV